MVAEVEVVRRVMSIGGRVAEVEWVVVVEWVVEVVVVAKAQDERAAR